MFSTLGNLSSLPNRFDWLTCAKTHESNSESIFWRLVSSKFGAILWLAFLKMRDLETCINMGFLKETQLFYDVQCNFQNHSWTPSLARGLYWLGKRAMRPCICMTNLPRNVSRSIIKSSIWWFLKMAPKTHRFQYYGLMILMTWNDLDQLGVPPTSARDACGAGFWSCLDCHHERWKKTR